MEENNIKKEINNILTHKKGIEIYVYIKVNANDEEKLEIRKLNAQDDFRDALQKRLESKLNEKYCNEDVKYVPIENYDEIKDTYCVIDKSEYDGLNMICEFDEIEKFYKYDEGDIQGFIFRYGTETNYIILYQQFYPVNLLKRGKTIMGCIEIIAGQPQFKLIENNIIKITDNIDIIILSQYIISNNFKILENKFGFQKYIENISNNVENEIKNIGMIEETDTINNYLNDYKIKKKLAKIKGSKVLKMDKEIILKRISEDDYYKQSIKIENGKIKIESKKDFGIFLKLLNDDILKSNITSTTYDTSSKKEMEKEKK